MNHSSSKAFTLFEMMVVICLICALAFFTIRYTTRYFLDSLADSAASQVHRIKQASYDYVTTYASWPDMDNNCADAANLLRPFMGSMPQNPWGYDFELRCPEILLPPPKGSNAAPRKAFPSLIIRQQVRNLNEAKQMIGKVVSTELVEDGDKLFVDTYVPMYIMPPFYDHSQEVEVKNGRIYFSPINCPAGTRREVVVLPKKICGVDGAMKGYRVQIINTQLENKRPILLYEVKDSHNNWVDGFQACGITAYEYKEIFSIHQICQSQ